MDTRSYGINQLPNKKKWKLTWIPYVKASAKQEALLFLSIYQFHTRSLIIDAPIDITNRDPYISIEEMNLSSFKMNDEKNIKQARFCDARNESILLDVNEKETTES